MYLHNHGVIMSNIIDIKSPAKDSIYIVKEEKVKFAKGKSNRTRNKDYNMSEDESMHVLAIEKIIGYEFNDFRILINALSHVGYNIQNHIIADGYQRMEYLGDALLDFIVADELYNKYPNYDEGILTKLRSNVVSKTPLAKIIDSSGIVDHILYDRVNTSLSDKLKSDIFESLVAGIYLDSNSLKSSKAFVLKYIRPLIAMEDKRDVSDYKSMLYEFCTQNNRKIEFVLVKTEGPPHDLKFYYDLKIDDVVLSSSDGMSKREATQNCSHEAMEKLGAKEK